MPPEHPSPTSPATPERDAGSTGSVADPIGSDPGTTGGGAGAPGASGAPANVTASASAGQRGEPEELSQTDASPPGEAQPDEDQPGEDQPRRRWSLRRTALLLLAGLLAVLSLVGGGVGLGWKLANDQQAAREPEPLPSVITVPQAEYGDSETARMPDVRGLTQQTAEQVLADAGVDIGQVGFQQVPWAGSPGQVVEQQPVAGTENPNGIILRVSKQATVPTVEGVQAATVANGLSALGVEVLYASEYRAGVDGGTALAIDPAPGEPLPDRVTVTVAETANSVMLSALRAVEGGGSSTAIDLAGIAYPNSLVVDAHSDARDHEWLLSKVVDSVEGTVGIPDTAASDGSAKVEVLADGKVVAKLTVAYGKPKPLKAKVTGALRLTVRVKSTSPEDNWTELGFGDLKLVGGSEALQKLGSE